GRVGQGRVRAVAGQGQGVGGAAGRGERRVGLVVFHLFLGAGAVVLGLVVVAERVGVDGAPDVVASDRGVGRQFVAGRRAVGAVADRKSVVEGQSGAVVLQGEDDDAGGEGGAGEERR